MSRKTVLVFAGLPLLLAMTMAAGRAQAPEVKEKPPMYTYVANWTIPRARWAEMEKTNVANRTILDKAIANGTIVAYGDDTNLVHEADGSTHDNWWSAMSMSGLLNVLDQFAKPDAPRATILESSTKHSDAIFVSRFYNWHSGSWKDAYTHGSTYKLKPDASDDALETLSKHLFVPLLEKLLAEGAIHEYEVDTQAIHKESPNMFYIFYITPNAEGLDKVNAALRETMKANPLGGPAFSSVSDFTAHRDELAHTNATYK